MQKDLFTFSFENLANSNMVGYIIFNSKLLL